jgi:hypothetical protein
MWREQPPLQQRGVSRNLSLLRYILQLAGCEVR